MQSERTLFKDSVSKSAKLVYLAVIGFWIYNSNTASEATSETTKILFGLFLIPWAFIVVATVNAWFWSKHVIKNALVVGFALLAYPLWLYFDQKHFVSLLSIFLSLSIATVGLSVVFELVAKMRGKEAR